MKIKLLLLIKVVLFAAYCIQAQDYNHDGTTSNDNNQWMARLPDKTELRQISLPGTHDTMAFYGGDSAQCQSLSLSTQLKAGIRYLDIRCRHVNNNFVIHHDLVHEKIYFDGVLNDVSSFLGANPTECLLMRVKKKYKPVNNTRSFADSFKSYRDNYTKLFWNGSTDNPTLKDCRGKVVVLQGFSSPNTKYGLNYTSFNIENAYHITTNWDLYGKWEKVRDQLNTANQGKGSQYFLNHLTASGGYFPYFIASGHSNPQTNAPRLLTGLTTPGWKSAYPDFPRVGCFLGICSIAFEGMNALTNHYIQNNGLKFVGILIADFPGDRLINTIIACN